jgi:para-nitrobenzyl esterase
MNRTAVLCILSLMVMLGPTVEADDGAVSVTGGQVSGASDEAVTAYLGIPYAAPPVGDLRWRPPQPVVPWEGVRGCVEFGPACPQTPYPRMSLYYREPEAQSEDCLYLNVWTATEADEEPRPVMVWIHGGGLTRGSGAHPVYDGAALVKKGVVLVTINYRLNVFGFFAHPELSAESEHGSSGAYGILDQIAALEWVRDNIAAFGGDPDNVTIFGESAGSWSVSILNASPLAKGLFHRAIGQSGGQFGPAAHLKEERYGMRSAEAQGLDFAARAGALLFLSGQTTEARASDPGEPHPATLEELRGIEPERLLEVLTEMEAEGVYHSRMPVEGWVLPDEVRAIFARGEHNDVPLLIGSNKDEMTSLTDPRTHPATLEALRAYVEENYEGGAAAYLAVYTATSDADARRSYLDGLRDARFTLNMRRWAQSATANGTSPVFLYYFTREPRTAAREFYRAYHAAEIAYAFDNLGAIDRTAHEDWDHALADIMSDYWVIFSKTGQPNGEGLPWWPVYELETAPYLELGDEIRAGTQLLQVELDYTEGALRAR